MKKYILPLVIGVALIGCKAKETATTTPVEEEVITTAPNPKQAYLDEAITIPVQLDETADIRAETDAFNIQKIEQIKNFLVLTISYGGGCREHDFVLVHNGAYKESMPPQLDVQLRHNAHDDRCRALLTQQYKIDLSTLQYTGSDKLVLNFAGRKETFTATY